MKATIAFALVCGWLLIGSARDGGSDATTPLLTNVSDHTAASPPQQSPIRPTPTPTPSDITTNCPVLAIVCQFASELVTLVRNRDAAGVIALARAKTVTCPSVSIEYRPAVRAGLGEGEIRQGFPVAYLQSEGSAVSEMALVAVLNEWFDEASPAASDPLGDGEWRLAAVGCGRIRRDNADTVSCDVRFGAVFTAIGESGRVIMEFVVEQQPTPAIELFVHGIESINQEFVRGGHSVLPLRFDFEDRNGTDYFAVRIGPE